MFACTYAYVICINQAYAMNSALTVYQLDISPTIPDR